MRLLQCTLLLLIGILGAVAQAQAPSPTPEEFQQLRNAMRLWAAAIVIAKRCGFDLSVAGADMKSAVEKWGLTPSERKGLLTATMAGSMSATDAIPGAPPPDWCEKQRPEFDEVVAFIHQISIGQPYTGPLFQTR